MYPIHSYLYLISNFQGSSNNQQFIRLVNTVDQVEDIQQMWDTLRAARNNFLNNKTDNLKCTDGVLKDKEALMDSLFSKFNQVSEEERSDIREGFYLEYE